MTQKVQKENEIRKNKDLVNDNDNLLDYLKLDDQIDEQLEQEKKQALEEIHQQKR